MRRRRLALAVLLLAIPCLAPPAAAQDRASAELGVLGGFLLPDDSLVGDDSRSPEPTIGVRAGFAFSPRWSYFLDALYAEVKPETSPVETRVFDARSGFELRLQPARANPWFVTFAGGRLDLRLADGSGFDGSFVSAGVGKRVRLSGRHRFHWELRGDRTVGDGFRGRSLTQAQALFGVTWGLGRRPADADEDGVFDRQDRCPDTPAGALVDPRGCPSDTDGDGVLDGFDRCPGTRTGRIVAGDGCPVDDDDDGVPDDRDRCPATPPGTSVDATGCPADADDDGVADASDRCPDTPPRTSVDATGCPADADGDGVADANDRCPDTPAGTSVDATGCPPLLADGRALVLEGVRFAWNSAELTERSEQVLDRVAAALRERPGIRIEIGGHTDSSGDEAYNRRLSRLRAEAVRGHLVRRGVALATLAARGYGSSRPVADNATEAGRALNRRVELRRAE